MYENRHIPWDISDDRRREYAKSSRESQAARKLAEARASAGPVAKLTVNYDPSADMPRLRSSGLSTLSLFSGGGGLDLGFDLAGFEHRASYEILEFAGETLRRNRPMWNVYSGAEEGDVRNVDWSQYAGQIDVLHGGPPCQPFSIAGRRGGDDDTRDMFPQFIKSVEKVKPRVFVAENVLGFMSQKFSDYRSSVVERLSKSYRVSTFKLSAADFGVPQDRRRVFVVGVKKSLRQTFDPKIIEKKEGTTGVRLALGLPERAIDGLAPTLRCTLTGPRQTTSIANSTASVHKWTDLGIWPHGVSPDRSIANAFPTKNQTYRLCVEECQVLQGFPLDWAFTGAVYQRLGLIGNSVCPPVGYAVAKAIRDQVFKY